MLSRREFLQVAGATATVTGLGGRLARVVAQQAIRQEDLLRFEAKGQLTLLHFADCHAQLRPIYHREPSLNLGVGEAKEKPPHLFGEQILKEFAIAPRSYQAYMLSSSEYETLARTYGRVGGMEHMATLINAIRAERGNDRVLLLDGGDALQGSYTALSSRGADMIKVLEQLDVAATTGHWEFVLGAERIVELFGDINHASPSKVAFLAGNVRDNEFDEPVFHATRFFSRGGITIAVIGQAFPYTPIANPPWMVPKWSFGIREDDMRRSVLAAREQGAALVVVLSHNGFDVDRKMARRVPGIDVILTAHTHDALPVLVKVNQTLLVASGSHAKFLSRLDIELKGRQITDYNYALLPVLADAIAPDTSMTQTIKTIRAPHEAMLSTELAHTEALLYRRGNFAGTLDDVVCEAILSERDAQICFSPGFRWGNTLLAGDPITWDDVYNFTAVTYPACYRTTMTGETIKTILEDVADNLFNPDPYYQQGGDMVRAGGLGFAVHVDAPMGRRISDLRLLKSGEPLGADQNYVVAGWASVNQQFTGPAIWDVLARHLQREKNVRPRPVSHVEIVRGRI
jgi:S-sulfosulfanyl-L-cysteine sulfohydrolase